MSGFSLFTSTKTNLQDFFKSLNPDDIQDCCEFRIFQRGEEYFDNDLVDDAAFSFDINTFSAIVEGNEKYKVTIIRDEGNVTGSCTCPYGGICKHIVAALLYAVENAEHIEIINDNKIADNSDNYLQSLSKQQLISLVKKHAPAQFFNEIQNKTASASDALNIFNKVEKNIGKLFQNDELLYNPADFEEQLDTQIEKLKGLEKQLPKQISDLIIFVINKVENAFDEGYLYVDSYYGGDDYYEAEHFNQFVINFISTLPFNEKQTYIHKLYEVFSNLSYDTFSEISDTIEKSFTNEDIPALKEMVLLNCNKFSPALLKKYYAILREHLSDSEKENILLFIIKSNYSNFTLELAEFYKTNNRIPEAISVLEQYLKQDSDRGVENIYVLYLNLLKSQNISLSPAANDAIIHCPSSDMLKIIISLLPEDASMYESLLEQKSADNLLAFYETSDRLNDANVLIKRSKKIWEDRKYDFYKKHKTLFPSESEEYFLEVLNKNLHITGDRAYNNVAEVIGHMKKINIKLTDELLKDIRTNYSRRRKLISLLAKY